MAAAQWRRSGSGSRASPCRLRAEVETVGQSFLAKVFVLGLHDLNDDSGHRVVQF